MILAPPPPPPAVEQPAPYQISYGTVAGIAAAGTRRIIVRVDSRVAADLPLRGRHFQLRVTLPTRETSIRVVAVGPHGRSSSTAIAHVFGAAAAARPAAVASRLDPRLQAVVRRLARRFGNTSGIYVQNLVTGEGAAWNARAIFPGASALKLAIAAAALTRTDGTPLAGSPLDRLLQRMLVDSDNGAANAVERWYGGSTSGGSAIVNDLMRSIGLSDTEMYGGYELDGAGGSRSLAASIPLEVDEQPSWGIGKRTSAYDLASLLRAVWLASGGRGPLRVAQPGFTPADARYLLYVLAHVHDHGKIDRRIGALRGVAVLHKAGWIDDARHDNGLVLWSRGAIVVTVMTYRAGGAGVSSDILAGDVAAAALARFRG